MWRLVLLKIAKHYPTNISYPYSVHMYIHMSPNTEIWHLWKLLPCECLLLHNPQKIHVPTIRTEIYVPCRFQINILYFPPYPKNRHTDRRWVIHKYTPNKRCLLVAIWAAPEDSSECLLQLIQVDFLTHQMKGRHMAKIVHIFCNQ